MSIIYQALQRFQQKKKQEEETPTTDMGQKTIDMVAGDMVALPEEEAEDPAAVRKKHLWWALGGVSGTLGVGMLIWFGWTGPATPKVDTAALARAPVIATPLAVAPTKPAATAPAPAKPAGEIGGKPLPGGSALAVSVLGGLRPEAAPAKPSEEAQARIQALLGGGTLDRKLPEEKPAAMPREEEPAREAVKPAEKPPVQEKPVTARRQEEVMLPILQRLRLAIAQRDPSLAEKTLKELERQQGKESLFAMKMRGYWHLTQGEWEQAEHLLTKVLLRMPEDVDANLNLAVVEAATRRLERAGQRLERVLRDHPDDARALAMLERVMASRGP